MYGCTVAPNGIAGARGRRWPRGYLHGETPGEDRQQGGLSLVTRRRVRVARDPHDRSPETHDEVREPDVEDNRRPRGVDRIEVGPDRGEDVLADRRDQWKLLPQAQLDCAAGLSIVNPVASREST